MPLDSPDGPTTEQCGPAPVPVSRSVVPESKPEQLTLGIFGQSSTDLSKPADLPLSSASKLAPVLDENGYQVRTKICKGCGTEKSFSEFYRKTDGTYRAQCKTCMALRERALRRRIDRGECELTGIPFNLDDGKRWDSPSLHRIDANTGYTPENTRVVLHCLNVMANVWGENKIIEIANAIMEKRRHRTASFQDSLTEALKRRIDTDISPEFALTWNSWDMPAGPPICRLRASARRISGNGYGGWPTPTALSYKDSHQPGTNRSIDKTKNLIAGWATPTVLDSKDRDYFGKSDLALPGQAKLSSPAQTENRGVLNPALSLWLMGYPKHWMEAAPSRASASSRGQAMPSSRR